MIFAYAAGAIAVGVVAGAFRNPAVMRTALRDFRRRPGQTLLLVAGLLVASVVIASALVAADSMRSLFLDRVYRAWGPVDLRAAALAGTPFEQTKAAEAFQDPGVVALSDGGSWRLSIPSSVEAPASGTRESRVNLIGIDPVGEATLGGLDPDDPEGAPAGGEAWVNQRLAEALNVAPGDSLAFRAAPVGRQFSLEVRVARILQNSGLADWELSSNAFVGLNNLREATGFSGLVNQILVSAPGSARSPRQAGELQQALQEALSGAASFPEAAGSQLTIAGSKLDDLEGAEAESEFFRAVLGMLGGVVALTSVALIVGLFVMLGEERRREMGTMRALGMRRSELLLLGLSEGTLYALAAAVIGAFAGLLLGRHLAGSLAVVLSGVAEAQGREALRVPLEVRPATLLGAAGASYLISLMSVASVSYRTSRLSVISAIRGLPELPRRSRRRGVILPVLAVLAGGALLVLDPLAKAAGGALMAVGLGVLLARWNRRAGTNLGSALALGYSLVAAGILDPGFEEDPNRGFGFLLVVGVVAVVAAVVLVTENLTVLARAGTSLGGIGRGILRTAASYAAASRLRSGLAIGMFALVIFAIAGFAVWGGLVGGDFEEQAGGFRVFARATVPIEDLELGDATVVPLYAGRYELGYEIEGMGEIFSPVVLYGVDETFVEENRFTFSKKPPGLSDREAWTRLVETPGTVVLDGGSTRTGAEVGNRVTFKTDRGDVDLEVVGVADEFLFQAVFMSKSTFQVLFSTRAADTAWMIRTMPEQVDRAIQDLEQRYGGSGLDALDLEQTFLDLGAQQRTFVGLFQLLLKLGLIIGISGLAIGAVRTVVERTHAVGVLRAVGFRRWMVGAWLLGEHLLLATLGVAVGLGVGLAATWLVLLHFEELTFRVDWSQIYSTVAIVYGAVIAFTLLPAWRAARLAPSEAVRYVE